VELRVHLLLLNAVMQSGELAALEGASLADGRHGRTLRLLRDFLASLAADASTRCGRFDSGNGEPLSHKVPCSGPGAERRADPRPLRLRRSEVVADSLLRNLQRWMGSPASVLHSRSLLALVKALMNKVFLQLVADVRKLDAVIVSASLDSIVICTGKHDLKARLGPCATGPLE